LSSPDEPQTSWKVIEEFAPIISSEGEKAGTVSRVVGDTDADVFTGLAVRIGVLGSTRFVPSEDVRAIWPDRIEVNLSKAELEELPEYEEVPVLRVEPKEPGFFAKLFGKR
jgi:sporulation protein YlmC with PRC-barrel domain